MLGDYTIYHYIGFFAVVFACLWIDLHAHKKDEAISMGNALKWSLLWIGIAILFGLYVGLTHGGKHASLYFSGYLLEKSLSVDNLFVMMAIFSAFAIKDEYQHRVLYYGILGALVLRIVFIAAGTSLVEMFGSYALTAFALFVLWTAVKMWQQMNAESEEIDDYSHHWAVRWTQKFMPVSPRLDGHKFFVKSENAEGNLVWMATPLFLCLIVIEISDVMFAFDSIPAIIAITQEPFLVYTSNIFAILGLRSLYFLMAGAKRYLCHLEKAVIAILAFIGIKMLAEVFLHIELAPTANLVIVGGLLAIGIAASFIWPEKKEDADL